MRTVRKVLYTVVFSLFFLIFAGVARDIMERVEPELIQVPSIMTGEFALKWIGIFTGVVLLSFWGAGAVVYKNLSGREMRDRSWRDPEE